MANRKVAIYECIKKDGKQTWFPVESPDRKKKSVAGSIYFEGAETKENSRRGPALHEWSNGLVSSHCLQKHVRDVPTVFKINSLSCHKGFRRISFDDLLSKRNKRAPRSEKAIQEDL